MDIHDLRPSAHASRSRPLSDYGTVTFPARGYDRGDPDAAADASFWTARAVQSQQHTAYLITTFAPDEFDARRYLDHVWSRPVVVNGLDPHTQQSRHRIFQMKYAFRDAEEAAVTAIKNLLLHHAPRIQPDVADGRINQGRPGRTFGEPIWTAQVDTTTSDPATMQRVQFAVLACPIWMRHPNDEVPFLKGSATARGELADLFAVTVTILLRRREFGELSNLREQRNRFHTYVHVCVDRGLAIAAWLHAIHEHGDQYFKPEGDMQIPGGQTIGPWPPEGRLDLYWEGKTVDYEAIFIGATSMCFEPNQPAESSERLIKSAIDKLQQKRDGYIGSNPDDDVALRMLKKSPKNGSGSSPANESPFEQPPRYALRPTLGEGVKKQTIKESKAKEKTVKNGNKGKENKQQKPPTGELSPDSSLSSADASPERPDWAADAVDYSSSVADETSVEQQSPDDERPPSRSRITTPSPPPRAAAAAARPKEPDEYLSSTEDTHEPDTSPEQAPRIVRQRKMVQRLTRAMKSRVDSTSSAGAQRRRRIAEMNPEMERFAKGV